jgi:hypothetical protein
MKLLLKKRKKHLLKTKHLLKVKMLKVKKVLALRLKKFKVH